jgi:hypothetical protein
VAAEERANDVGFIITIDGGDLERKSLLLIDSIKTFGGPFSKSPIWVIRTTTGSELGSETPKRLESMDARLVTQTTQSIMPGNRFSNKIYAAEIGERIADTETIVFLDSDILCLSPPYLLRPGISNKVAVAPVAAKIVGQECSKNLSEFWKTIYSVCQVQRSRLWPVTTVNDRKTIWAYFNAGVISAKKSVGLFRKWKESFETIALDKYVLKLDPKASEFTFLDQAVLSAVILREFRNEEVRELPPSHNYSLIRQTRYPPSVRINRISEIALLHYHKEFYKLDWMRGMSVDEPYLRWILDRIPLPQA